MIELPIPKRRNREPNPALATYLLRTREFLRDGNSNSVGTVKRWSRVSQALIACGDPLSGVDSAAYAALQALVAKELHPYTDYIDWLENKRMFGLFRSPWRSQSTQAIQAAQLRWLNQLIEEFGGIP